jgi:hypothetical protein
MGASRLILNDEAKIDSFLQKVNRTWSVFRTNVSALTLESAYKYPQKPTATFKLVSDLT